MIKVNKFDITNCDLPKRTYLGFIYHSKCSECGSIIEFDFNRDYLSYPVITSYSIHYTKLYDTMCYIIIYWHNYPSFSVISRITSYNVCYTKLLRNVVIRFPVSLMLSATTRATIPSFPSTTDLYLKLFKLISLFIIWIIFYKLFSFTLNL